jgi:Arc-like DNA binding domain
MNTKPPIVHINVRFPVELIEELRRIACEDGRSLHGEILWILRDYVAQRKRGQV